MKTNSKAILMTDGASKGNPGPAGIGVVLKDESGIVLAEVAEPIGVATNNEAEYAALIRGLQEAKRLRFTRVEWRTDSELAQRQWTGEYKVRSPRLQGLYTRAKLLASEFDEVVARHVPREANKEADVLANDAIKHLDLYR